MERKTLEIATSTGMVLMLIVLLIAIQIAFPVSLRPTGFVGAVALYIILMSIIGIKLANTRQQI